MLASNACLRSAQQLLRATCAAAWPPSSPSFAELISLRHFGAAAAAPAAAAAAEAPSAVLGVSPPFALPGSAGATSAALLDGKAVAAAWLGELEGEVADVVARGGRPPGLGVIVVGDRPDSLLYVLKKQEACARVGMHSRRIDLPATATQADVVAAVAALSADGAVDGVLVQLPLPAHIDEDAVIEGLNPRKDVDGLHPLNMGRILMRGRAARLIPCTALGTLQLLERSGVRVADRSVVVMGDSNIVGMPLSMLFRDSGAAAVTVIHRTSYAELFEDSTSVQRAKQRAAADACMPRVPGPLARHAIGTRMEASPLNSACGALHVEGLPAVTRTADILVVAVGFPRLVTRDWVKPGAVVVDVGINVVGPEHSSGGGGGGGGGGGTSAAGEGRSGGSGGSGLLVVGDVDLEDVAPGAAAVSPVPGGIGPMTIAALLHNTVRAARDIMDLRP